MFFIIACNSVSQLQAGQVPPIQTQLLSCVFNKKAIVNHQKLHNIHYSYDSVKSLQNLSIKLSTKHYFFLWKVTSYKTSFYSVLKKNQNFLLYCFSFPCFGKSALQIQRQSILANSLFLKSIVQYLQPCTICYVHYCKFQWNCHVTPLTSCLLFLNSKADT